MPSSRPQSPKKVHFAPLSPRKYFPPVCSRLNEWFSYKFTSSNNNQKCLSKSSYQCANITLLASANSAQMKVHVS